MTGEQALSEREIFQRAISLPVRERTDYLDTACSDPVMRREVESLLAAHDGSDSFLETPAIEWTPEALGISGENREVVAQLGAVIGPYNLLQQIGEGGFGVVFLAEQSRPVRRTVALKIIKPGMDTRQVIARFEAERQALAMMDHPSIARVLDAGTTDAGFPYFVMELVNGVPITEYSDQQRLSVRQRLDLFSQVCHAVQHAHQKGIIHRDLKPSNVLVAEYDGRPVPKVIDFGVAKATGQQLSAHTMFTQFGQLIGTFEYMSPEQARFDQIDVDTRSDIYSLGVLLYELLTGSTPLPRSKLDSAAFDEALRIIREEEPPPPSGRLSSLDVRETTGLAGSTLLTAIASHRRTEPEQLGKELQGELDWIAMKCLEKDRSRRYETAAALAADVSHYLADEPVTAAAPTKLYRLRKFVRRNRVPVVAALLLAVAIITGIATSSWQAIRATRAELAALAERDAKQRALGEAVEAKEREAAQRQQAEEISNFLISAFTLRYHGRDIEAVTEVLKHSTKELQNVYADDSNANEALLATIGLAHAGLRQFSEAEKWYRKCLAVAKDPGLIDRIRRELAISLLRQGKSSEALPMLQEFYFQNRNWAVGANAEELLERWKGLPDVEARVPGQAAVDALELNGLSDYVILPRVYFDGRPPWTLEAIVWPAWIDMSNPTNGSPSGWSSLISAADGGAIGLESVRRRWTIELYTAGNPGAEWVDNYSSASARGDVALRQWQHVAGVWDGRELRLYVDGQLQNTRPGVDYCAQLTVSPLFIGADPANLVYGNIAEGFLNGRLRAARISRAVEYADSFSPPQRLEKTPGAIGLYDFTIDTGHFAIDRSGHGNHGIIIGAKYVKANAREND